MPKFSSMVMLVGAAVLMASTVQGRSSGAPYCTLDPAHGGYPPQSSDWRDKFVIKIHPINENMLIDPKNKTGKVDPRPNGNFVVILPKTKDIKIKGFTVRVKAGAVKGGQEPQFTMIHRNHKLRKMDCSGGQLYLTHKDASEKDSVSFFFRHRPDYAAKGLELFEATIVENFNNYYANVKF